MNKKLPAASENEIGKIKSFNNNNWIVLHKNNIKKWVSIGQYKKYYTIDNGDKKYKVIITDTHIYIFNSTMPLFSLEKKGVIELKKNQKFFFNETLIYEIKNYKNIFIGKNTKKYRIYDKLFTGSSILVEIKKNEYIFIGNKIMKFSSKEPIIEFHSIMGNSSVVYPFALTDNYAYLIYENIYLQRDFNDKDPYEVYYDFKKIWKRKSYKFNSKILYK